MLVCILTSDASKGSPAVKMRLIYFALVIGGLLCHIKQIQRLIEE